jgi:hypothetical protein
MRQIVIAALLVLATAAPSLAEVGLTCPPSIPREPVQSEAAPQPPRPGSAFHVAAGGSDSGDGTSAHPFASLERARDAMRRSTIRTTYLTGGIWQMRSPLVLGPQDASTSYIADGGDASVLAGNGTSSLVVLHAASNVTISGLTMRQAGAGGAIRIEGGGGHRVVANTIHDSVNGMLLDGSSGNSVVLNRILRSAASGIEAKNGSNANVFDSNRIEVTCAIGTRGGGLFVHGGNDNRITYNLVQDTAGMGIGVLNWDDETVNLRTVIRGNIVRATNRMSYDSGAIYLLGRSHRDMHAVIEGNLIDGAGGENDHTIGIYLDDSTSGVEVRGNIVRRPGTHAVQVHGGDGITLSGNILDLGTGRASAVLFQSAPADTNPSNTMLDNRVSGNIVLSASALAVVYDHIEGGVPDVRDNLYYSTAGVKLMARDVVVDSAPVFADPGFVDAAAGDYRLLPDGAARKRGFHEIDSTVMGPRTSPQ